MTGTLATGISVSGGTAVIKQSDITSTGKAGKGIVLSGSGTYTLGADDDEANIELLATGIELNTAQTVNIYNNFIGTDGNQNTKGIHTTTNNGTATLKNNHFDNTTSIHLAANTTLNSTDDTTQFN